MVRDDLEACLQAYQFAELLLAGWQDKREKERDDAVTAAQRLRSDVEPRYAAALESGHYDDVALARLKAARQKLEDTLTEIAKKV